MPLPSARELPVEGTSGSPFALTAHLGFIGSGQVSEGIGFLCLCLHIVQNIDFDSSQMQWQFMCSPAWVLYWWVWLLLPLALKAELCKLSCVWMPSSSLPSVLFHLHQRSGASTEMQLWECCCFLFVRFGISQPDSLSDPVKRTFYCIPCGGQSRNRSRAFQPSFW